MKRRMSLLLCLLLGFGMIAGCGEKPEGTPGTAGPEEVFPVVVETPEPDGTPLPTPEPTEEPPPPDVTPEEPPPEGGHAWTLTPLGLDENVTFDVSGVGDATMVCFFVRDGSDGRMELWLEVNETPYQLEVDGDRLCGAWLYMKDGVATLMATVDLASSDYVTSCWQLRDGKPVQTGTALDGTVNGATPDGEIILERPVNVLGTWWASRYYDMDEAGVLAPVEGSLWEIVPADDMHLVTAATVPVEMLADDGFQADTVPAGTNLTPMATDDEQYFYFILDSGREGRIVFERRDYEIWIGGKPETELFEQLMYAG